MNTREKSSSQDNMYSHKWQYLYYMYKKMLFKCPLDCHKCQYLYPLYNFIESSFNSFWKEKRWIYGPSPPCVHPWWCSRQSRQLLNLPLKSQGWRVIQWQIPFEPSTGSCTWSCPKAKPATSSSPPSAFTWPSPSCPSEPPWNQKRDPNWYRHELFLVAHLTFSPLFNKTSTVLILCGRAFSRLWVINIFKKVFFSKIKKLMFFPIFTSKRTNGGGVGKNKT